MSGVVIALPLLRPIVVPVRQNISVTVDVRGLAPGGELPDGIEPFDFVFHMEGLVSRDTP